MSSHTNFVDYINLHTQYTYIRTRCVRFEGGGTETSLAAAGGFDVFRDLSTESPDHLKRVSLTRTKSRKNKIKRIRSYPCRWGLHLWLTCAQTSKRNSPPPNCFRNYKFRLSPSRRADGGDGRARTGKGVGRRLNATRNVGGKKILYCPF